MNWSFTGGIRSAGSSENDESNENRTARQHNIQLEFAQRYIYSGKFRKEMWDEYCKRLNIKE